MARVHSEHVPAITVSVRPYFQLPAKLSAHHESEFGVDKRVSTDAMIGLRSKPVPTLVGRGTETLYGIREVHDIG